MFSEFPYSNKNDLNLDWIIEKIKQMEKIIGGAVSDVAQFLSKKGGKMEGAIDMQGNRIFNAPTPAGESDVATKKYVDDHSGGDYLPLTGGAMTGAVNMGGNKITSVATPTADTDVATKKYVDDHSGGGGVSGDYLPLSGGTMSGAVNMGGNKITSVANPTADTDVATKKYVDEHGGGGGVSGDYLPLSGGTMSGAVNMGGNKITSVATPTADTDVATKKYVDDHSGGGNVDAICLPIGRSITLPFDKHLVTYTSPTSVECYMTLPFIYDDFSKLTITAGDYFAIHKISDNSLVDNGFSANFSAGPKINGQFSGSILLNITKSSAKLSSGVGYYAKMTGYNITIKRDR